MMFECSHMTLGVVHGQVECKGCHAPWTGPLLVNPATLTTLLLTLQQIAEHLEQAEMTDVATLIRSDASRLLVERVVDVA